MSDLTDVLENRSRLAALRRTGLLDSPPEESFDRLTRLASRVLRAPVSLVSLVDDQRQFFKAQCGLGEPWASTRETPLSHSFCQHVVHQAIPLVIGDAREHPLVRDNLAIPQLGVIAYAGVPLQLATGEVIGSFCVIDTEPRTWTEDEVSTLRDLAASVVSEIELRRDIAERQRAKATLAQSERAVRALYRVASNQALPFDEKVRGLLKLGSERFGLPIGILSRIEADTYTVVQSYPGEGALVPGASFPLEELYCSRTAEVPSPVSIEHAAESDWRSHACYAITGLEAYLGTAVHVNGRRFGTFCFSGPTPREEPFSDRDYDFLQLMAQWVGQELEQRQTQEALLEREQRYRDLVEAASDIIYSTDAEGRFTYVNPIAVQATGYPAAELIGRHYLTLVREDFRPTTRTFYQRQLHDRVSTSYFEFPIVSREGRELWLGQNLSLQTEGGKVTGTHAVARDVTGRREVDQMKDEFISVVSHELRTPLTSIRGSLGLLTSGKAGAIPAQAQRLLTIAAQNTDRLVRLINDILDIERIESGKIKLEPQELSAAELMEQAADTMQPLAERGEVTLHTIPLHTPLFADPDRTLQTLTNLLSNAIKFSPPGSVVTLRAEVRGGEVVFAVEDRGRGIPADQLERVFERFQQVDSSDARSKGGSGLGLAICRSIVQQHGGRIWVESVWGEGSTFFFTLPLVNPATATPSTNAAAPAVPVSAGPRVLVHTRDPQAVQIVQTALEQRGYSPVAVQSLEQIVAEAARRRPTAILLDTSIPEPDARALLTELKTRESTRDAPVVVLSAPAPDSQATDLPAVVRWITSLSAVDAATQPVPARAECADVLLVEDDVDLARVVMEMLRNAGITCRHATCGSEAIRLSQAVHFKLLVLDLQLPDATGYDVVAWLRGNARLNSTPLVVYTAQDLSEADRERLRLGPTEYMVKSRVSPEEFERRVVELVHQIAPAPATAIPAR